MKRKKNCHEIAAENKAKALEAALNSCLYEMWQRGKELVKIRRHFISNDHLITNQEASDEVMCILDDYWSRNEVVSVSGWLEKLADSKNLKLKRKGLS